MIVLWAMELFSKLFVLVTDITGGLPDLPQNFIDAFDTAYEYMFTGFSIFNFFLPVSILLIAFEIWITMWVFEKVILFILFILRKIPWVNIK